MKLRARAGFSLLEVLFSISFLVLVGFAVIALNVASLRLVTDAELKTVAYGLNDETIAYLTLLKKQGAISDHVGKTTYLNCPSSVSQQCNEPSSTPVAVQVGRSRLQFIRKIILESSGGDSGSILARTSVEWGSGVNRKIETVQFVE